MTQAPREPAVSSDVRKEIMASVGRAILREFNVAFVLMSLIPLCIGIYVLAARLFTINIFEGMTGLYFAIAIVFALLGFLVARQILVRILTRLIDTSAQLRQHEVLKSAFIANVAYELRPPLAAVKMSLKNLIDGLLGPLTAPQHTTVAECHHVVGRLTRTASDLIELTDRHGTAATIPQEVFEWQAALREVVRVNEPYLRAHRLSVDLQMPEAPVLFFGNQEKLVQAFGSLIDHAVRWSSEGSAIRMELAFLPQELRVIVSHDISSNHADFARQLDSFQRLGGVMEQTLGLGLHVAKDIIELHHGRFWIEGQPGQDGRLVVSLPVLESAPSVTTASVHA